jgi:hypothetical protein
MPSESLLGSGPGLLLAQTPAQPSVQRASSAGTVAVLDTARTPAMASVAGPRPACGVHRSGSVVRGPGCPARPVSGPSGGCPVAWVHRPWSGVRPAGVHPSVRSPPSRPRKPGGGLGGHVGAAGNLHNENGSSCRWSWVSEQLGRRPESAWRGAMRWRSCGGGRGASVAELAGSCSGAGCGRGRPLTGQGSARREGRRWLPATPRHGSVGWSVRFLHLRVAASVAWTRDYAGWSLSSLTTEWTGLEGSTSSTVRMRRGPSAAQPGSERDRLGADNAMTCANSGGRDRV